MTKTLALVFMLALAKDLSAQTADSASAPKPDTTRPVKVEEKKPEEKKANTLIISAEMRVRSEFRHGYRALPLKIQLLHFFLVSVPA